MARWESHKKAQNFSLRMILWPYQGLWTSLANGFYVPHMHMVLNSKHIIKYHTAIKWADGRATGTYFCENDQKRSKFPLASHFMAISGSVDSTTSIVF